MRAVVLCLGACVLNFGASFASAQNPAPLVRVEVPPSKNPAPSHSSRRTMTAADQQIYDRAVMRAREREVRIESKKLVGLSAARPATAMGNYNLGNEWYGWRPGGGVYAVPPAYYYGR
ncbi:MAG: hypothetical protein IT428_33060 [Planctomycetaceae bacterium]|nr:hypothetical protein [Planctomycetaceae bacterium]